MRRARIPSKLARTNLKLWLLKPRRLFDVSTLRTLPRPRDSIREIARRLSFLLRIQIQIDLRFVNACGVHAIFSHVDSGNLVERVHNCSTEVIVLPAELIGIGVTGAILVLSPLAIQNELLLTTVDPLHAQVIGLSSERMRYLLLVLLALSVVTAIQAVGVVLTSALLVTPAATASLLTKLLHRMLLLSVLFSTCVSVIEV